MEKSFLEKQIEKQAREQLDREYFELRKFVVNHPIGGSLHLGSKILFTSAGSGTSYPSVFNNSTKDGEGTNLEAVLKKRLERIIEEKTTILLKKIESLSYLFD